MEQKKKGEGLSGSDETVVRFPRKRSRPPYFNEKSIRSARPAVPLDERARERKPRSRTPLLLALAAAFGILAGVFGMSLYNQQRRVEAPTLATQEPLDESAATNETSATEDAPLASPDSPVAIEDASASDAEDADGLFASQASPGDAAGEVAGRGTEASSSDVRETNPSGGVEASTDERAALSGALNEWLSATNARDIGKQMDLYNKRLDAFYLSRNASIADVRAEKERVFGRAAQIEVEASGPPTIRVSPDGRTATMRFRKRYSIEGEGVGRSGEVVQELRWRKTDEGWKIVSERDLRVVN